MNKALTNAVASISVGLVFLPAYCPALAATDAFLTLSAPTVAGAQLQFTLTGESGVSYVIEASTNLTHWSPVATNEDAGFVRTIQLASTPEVGYFRARREPLPLFNAAIVARQNINFIGNLVKVDSFDSGDPNFSTNGRYDPIKTKAGGDVASEGTAELGNADIKGKLKTGPDGTYSLGPHGSVGDLDWPSSSGIQPGWHENDFRFVYPDVQLPEGYSDWAAPTASPDNTNHWILSGDYFVPDQVWLGAGRVVWAMDDSRLVVGGSLGMTLSAQIIVSAGATLKLYVIGESASLTTVNTPGDAAAFAYFGLPTNTNFTWSGNTEFVGTIYAPQAKITMAGGGNNVTDFLGACVANEVRLLGHFNFHYDENLRRKGPKR